MSTHNDGTITERGSTGRAITDRASTDGATGASELSPEWSPDDARPARKRGVPRWLLWGCGCGCLGFVMLLLALAGSGYLVLKDSEKPEVQWAHLGEQLPFETQPTDLTMLMGYRIPKVQFLVTIMPRTEEYHLRDTEDGYNVIVRVVPDEDTQDRYMDPTSGLPGFAVTDGELFTFDLQGQVVSAMRFSGSDTNIPFVSDETLESMDQGPGVRVVIPRPEQPIVVELRNGLVDAAGQRIPLSDEQIADFFDHFTVWP
ncbi:MAG: hypothetical protein ACI8PQ_003344 [Planctomycetota bacterium]|jgi:hypothetical protein